jgi:hypothetical protein
LEKINYYSSNINFATRYGGLKPRGLTKYLGRIMRPEDDQKSITDLINIKCSKCGNEATLREFATWEKNGKRGLLGKDGEGFIYLQCKQCGQKLKYDSLHNLAKFEEWISIEAGLYKSDNLENVNLLKIFGVSVLVAGAITLIILLLK